MIDHRLLGSWKSDDRRTMRDFRKLKGMPERALTALRKKIFGKLIHRWTRTEFCTAFDGDEDWTEVTYRVLAKDDDSVALWISADPESFLFEEKGPHPPHPLRRAGLLLDPGRDAAWVDEGVVSAGRVGEIGEAEVRQRDEPASNPSSAPRFD